MCPEFFLTFLFTDLYDLYENQRNFALEISLSAFPIAPNMKTIVRHNE